MFFRSKYLSPADEGGENGSASTGSSQNLSEGTSESSAGGGSSAKDEFVPKEAYDRIQADLVKIRNKNKELSGSLSKFESDQRAAEEQSLLDEKNYQQLIDNQKSELENLKGKIGVFEAERVEARKFSAFTRELGESIPDKYLPVIPLDKIEVFEDGSVNADSVKKTASDFKSEYSEIFAKKGKTPPGNFPAGSGAKMSVKEWKAQGKEKGSKWMKKNQSNVDWKTD